MSLAARQNVRETPVLVTARLTLRVPRMDDFPDFARFFGSDRSRFMGGPGDVEAAWFWFCSDVGQWSLFGHGALMIHRNDTGQTIGQVGINAGPLFPERELGWFLYDGFEGQGYATEAASALRDWTYAEVTADPLVSYMHPDNVASARLAERLGAVLDADAVRTDPIDLVYRHLAPGSRA